MNKHLCLKTNKKTKKKPPHNLNFLLLFKKSLKFKTTLGHQCDWETDGLLNIRIVLLVVK